MVEAKKPIQAQLTYKSGSACTMALSAKHAAVQIAPVAVSQRQLSRFIQMGAPSVPSK